MARGEESWCCSFFLHACALNISYGVFLCSYVLVWRVLVMSLIFLLCACACSVGHGVALSSYMLVCMMLIMVLLYVLWWLCTQWRSWRCSHLTLISLLSSFVLVWMALAMVLLFFFFGVVGTSPWLFLYIWSKRLLLVLLLVLMPFEALLSNEVRFFSFFIFFSFLSYVFLFQFMFSILFYFYFLIILYSLSFSIFSFLVFYFILFFGF